MTKPLKKKKEAYIFNSKTKMTNCISHATYIASSIIKQGYNCKYIQQNQNKRKGRKLIWIID